MAATLAWDSYNKDFASLKERHLDFRGQLISAARSDGPCRLAEMGIHLADANGVEEPHSKLSPVSLQYDTADVTDNNNFGTAIEVVRRVVLV
jgi:hypothetical protein